MADIYSIKSVYTKYSYVSSVIYGLMYAPNLVHQVYDLYLTYG